MLLLLFFFFLGGGGGGSAPCLVRLCLCYNFPLSAIVLSMVALTEAVDPLVGTVSSVTAKEGSRGELICNYQRDALAVYWKKGNTSSTAVYVVILDLEYNKGRRSGPGFVEGRFDMTDNYTLVINDVMVKDEGRYFCEVSDHESGTLYRNYTDVQVIGKLSFRILSCYSHQHFK